MKKYLTYLRCVFWAKVLREVQFIRVRAFIPGIYVCIDVDTKIYLEVKRLSELAEVYEVRLQAGSEQKIWLCSLDYMFLLTSHDLQKTLAFIPEEGKLIYEGAEFVKTFLKN